MLEPFYLIEGSSRYDKEYLISSSALILRLFADYDIPHSLLEQ
jgi:hypothetical protein